LSKNLQPVVLCLSGLDPSGGAGIQADIETLASLGCHCAPIITTLTVQDSCNVTELSCVDPAFITRQMAVIFADMKVSAIKIGLLGSTGVTQAIAAVLEKHPNIPVIIDPVLKASGGTELANQRVIESIRQHLLPKTSVITPNADEAQKLSPHPSNDDAHLAQYFHSQGCQYLLITGGDSPADASHSNVTNTLYCAGQPPLAHHWPRLAGSFHGSGCTLAAAVSAFIALGDAMPEAVYKAQQYTHGTLKNAQALGEGALIPIRVPAQ